MENAKSLIKRWKFEIIGAAVGLVGGFLYWKYVGCISGTCPIQANWYTMAPYGMLFGILIGSMFRRRK